MWSRAVCEILVIEAFRNSNAKERASMTVQTFIAVMYEVREAL